MANQWVLQKITGNGYYFCLTEIFKKLKMDLYINNTEFLFIALFFGVISRTLLSITRIPYPVLMMIFGFLIGTIDSNTK